MRTFPSLHLVFLISGSLVLSSCAGSVSHRVAVEPRTSEAVVIVEKGPPSHAPAHGYRHKHGNVVIVYEASLGVYLVDGYRGVYFYDGYFFRTRHGDWQRSREFRGPWKLVSQSRLPKGLQTTQHAKAKKAK